MPLRSINKQLVQTSLLVPVAFAIQYLAEIEIARRIGPAQFGVFSLMTSLVATTVTITLAGIPLSFPSLQGRERRRIGHGVAIVFLLTILGTVAIFSFWLLVYSDLKAAGALAAGFAGSSIWLVRRYMGVATEQLVPGVFGPRELLVFPFVLVLLVYLDLSSGTNVFLVFAVSLFISEAIVFASLSRRSFSGTTYRLGTGRENREAIARGLGFLKNSLGNLAFTRADVLLVALVFDAEQLGNYALASRLALIGTLPIRILEVRYSPSIAKKFSEAGYAGARAELKSALPVSLALSLGLVVPAVVGSLILLGNMFEAFASVRGAVLVLLAAHQIASVLTPFGTFLSMTGHHHLRGNVTLVFALLLIPSLIAGAVFGGVFGACLAVAAVIITMRLVTSYLSISLA